MNLYRLVRRVVPGVFADCAYALICILAIIAIYLFWPATTGVFAYLKL